MSEIEFEPFSVEHRLQPTRELFAELDRAVGSPLPAAFVEFISRHGGSAPGNEQFFVVSPIKEPCSWGDFRVDFVFGFYTPGEGFDLRDQLKTYRGRMPTGMIPFATDPGGNLGVISTHGADAGAVYFRDHEHRELAPRKIDQVYAELEAKGIATRNLDIDQALLRWEELTHPYPGKPAGYGNLYKIAASIPEFVAGLRLVPYT